jgi:hypothetical protein
VSSVLAKLRPWGSAHRRIHLGPNRQVLPWVDAVHTGHKLAVSYYDVLRVIATHMGCEAWDDMRLCIAWITERVSWSRRTVERALRFLKDVYILRQDGELHVKRGRPVVRYRLGSTPECPLPWHVVEARETAGQGGNGVYTSSTGPSVLVEDQGDTPEEKFMSPAAGVSNYRSAKPIKTGPHVNVRGGAARQEPHLRWLRGLAEGLLARRGTTGPGGMAQASQDCRDGRTVSLGRNSVAAVTYCHPPTRGAAVQPFIDPVFGNLSRDTRLLYLGLREAHARGERTYSDPLFLKSQFFPYDADIDATYLQGIVDTLVSAGKAHVVDGDVVLSDPPATTKEVALLSAPKRTRAKAAVEDPCFALFWGVYPRRTGKGAARKAFATATAAGADPDLIIQAAVSYRDRCDALQKEPQFIPHPATWLNQERWEDDEEQAPRVRSKVDDALRSGMDLVNFYQQQETIPLDGPKELGW